ncbi:MAG: hypothetical protein DRQ01_09235 [Ignavibacteriae bacterium]|nr:MAG: hypothetical protein DRQ01_09235 [Ignavibacteriota bacterium]
MASPLIKGKHTSDGRGTGNYTSKLTGLTRNTTYYVRAYASNSIGTVYGDQDNFTTNALLPTVSTSSISDITDSSAVSGGNITDDGGAEISALGVCWSTSPNPILSNKKTSEQGGTGSFSSTLSGLSCGTKYYIRAYATNSVGTVYGTQMSFSTKKCLLPTVTTSKTINANETSAIAGGNVTSNGGSTVTQRGVCWSTTPYPTTSDNKSNDGLGTGSYSSSISDISPNTTYYVKA